MAPDWLTVGWKVWSDPEMSFGRDYFLPLPKPDWTGVCKRMAEYADSAGLSVQLLRRLYVRVGKAPNGCSPRTLERALRAKLA